MSTSRAQPLDEIAAMWSGGHEMLAPLVLSAWPETLDPAECQVEPVPGGFSGATVWRVTQGRGCWALRRWPDPAPPFERIVEIHRLVRHLEQSGVEFVAVPRTTRLGETLLSTAGAHWQLEPWLPGVPIDAPPSSARLDAAMQGLAHWHRAAATYQPSAGAVGWLGSRHGRSPAIAERLTRARSLIAQDWQTLSLAGASGDWQWLLTSAVELLRHQLPGLVRELESVQEVVVPLQPCLRDVWRDHLLFEGDRLKGVIDPSAARSECVATDLARYLGSTVGNDSPRWQQAVEAYDAECTLTPAERRLLPVLDRSSVLLSMAYWIDRLCRSRPGPHAGQYAALADEAFQNSRVLERMRGFLDRAVTWELRLPAFL